MKILRAELARLVDERRARGLTHSQIADELGISRSYASMLATDPDGSKAAARKRSYRGTCRVCGGKTTGCNGSRLAPKICATCWAAKAHDERYWTRARIIRAIRGWAKQHGRPPKAMDWIRSTPGEHPAFSNVYQSESKQLAPFESWADAIEAAGFPRPIPYMYVRTEELREHLMRRSKSGTAWTRARIIQALQEWARTHGRPPTQNEWKHAAFDRPTYSNTVRRFGSWSAAFEAAGFEPREPGGRHRLTYVRSRVAA